MTMYYLHDGKDQLGPFTLDELKSLNPSPDANIWHKGLDGWKKAKDLEELKFLFDTPPPFNAPRENVQEEVPPPLPFYHKKAERPSTDSYPFTNEKSKSRKGLWIGLSIAVLLLIGVLAYNMQNTNNYASSDSSTNPSSYNEPATSPKTPEQLRQELLQKERNDFSTYLKSDAGTMQDNMVVTQTGSFWRREKKEKQGSILKGTIQNTATIAKYKDVLIAVTYLTETNTPIRTDRLTIYKFCRRGEATPYEFIVQEPTEMKHFSVEVVGAVAAN